MKLKNRREVEAYVEGTLQREIANGWIFERGDSARLWWTIRRVAIPPGEWSWQDYHLHVTEDLQWFIFTYGNDDIGAFSLRQEMQCARVISARSLEVYSLGDCLRYVLTNCKPNEWGYT